MEGKCLKPETVKSAFYELKGICRDIQFQLMGMVQNEGFPIYQNEILEFENNKNKIIERINKVSKDLKTEYDKL